MPSTDYYVHNIDPFLIHFYGDFGIRYYGLAYALGFIVAIWLWRRLYKHGKTQLDPDQQMVAMFALFLGVVIGGRLGHVVLYAWHDFIHDPLLFFRFLEGGMASHGGFVGVIVACIWISRHYKVNFYRLGDVLCLLTPPGLMLGRIANFINGELWGTVTHVPWAVIFPRSAPPGTPIDQIPPRHPSQLYEAALEGLLLMVYTQWRMWKTDVEKTPGRLSGEFFVGYAIVRVIGEQFRAPDAPPILGIQRGIFYSIFLVLVGIYFFWYSARKKSARATPTKSKKLKSK
jgi:phosphatidylglycerol:prolipoprotein diacylglycerol transferase